MTVHIGFVELCTAITADGKISNQATEVKMAVHIGFVKLCTAVLADGNYFKSGDRNENDRAFVKLCTVFNDDNISNQSVKNNAQRSRPDVFHKKGVLKNVPKLTGKHLCQGLLFNNNKVEKEIDNLPSWETNADRRASVLVRNPLGHRPTFRCCNLKHYITSIKSLW